MSEGPTFNLPDLFQPAPDRWGLRGDPHLWQEMAQMLENVPSPASEAEWLALLESTFEGLTGFPLSAEEPFFVKKFAHGGMSSGYISPQFWRETALPLLRARYAQAQKAGGFTQVP